MMKIMASKRKNNEFLFLIQENVIINSYIYQV